MSCASPQPHPTLIIVAAGSGTRFLASGGGTHKLQALLDGVSVLDRSVQNAEQSGLPWHLVRQGEGGAGMGDSIAAGVRATPDANGWLIVPADLPLIRPATLMRVALQLGQGTHEIVMPFFDGQQGHPVAFSRHCLDALRQLQGDKGAASIVREARAQGQVLDLPIDDDEGIVTDIDTVQDLARAQVLLLRARHADI
ncbi:nucleotidyltransferase family protein [Diaphorobacter sp. NR2-3-3-1]|nr:nucleotidyltransferase family protein [Diaphorobacter caeni]